MRSKLFHLLILSSLMLFTSCKEDDKLELPEREVEFFSSDHFKRFDPKLSAEDFLLDMDGSLVVVGNGREAMFSKRQPFILKLDLQKEIVWQKQFDLDQLNIYRRMEVISTADNSYAINTYALSGNPSQYDISLIKVSPAGQVECNKKFQHSTRSEKSASIIQLPNEDFIVLSIIEDSRNPLLSTHFQLNRISSTCDTVWSKLFENTDIANINSMASFQIDESFIFLTEPFSYPSKPTELTIYKFNFDGSLIWQKPIMLSEGVFAFSSRLSKIANDRFIVMVSTKTPNSYDSYDVVLKKMDLQGNEEWEYDTFSGRDTEFPDDLIQTKDGNLMLLSTTSSYGNGEFDVMLTKLDSEANVLWDKIYGGNSSDGGTGLLERENGNLIVLGSTNERNTSDGLYDFFILETDSNGNPL